MSLPTIEQALGPPNVECPKCLGTGWVCENHPSKAWEVPRGCGCGAGAPCICRPGVINPPGDDFDHTLKAGALE